MATPAFICRRVMLVFLALFFIAGCTSDPELSTSETAAAALKYSRTVFPIDVYDPWETWNRQVYRFNAELDRLVLLPVVNTYETFTPKPARDSVSNFFANLGTLTTFANQVLQLKIMEAAQSVYRFALNSTVGIFGLFDPATGIQVPKYEEDFGLTLGYWGMPAGPFVMLPLIGPSSVRDASGTAVDAIAFSQIDPFNASSFQWRYPPVLALNVINARYTQSFRYYQTGSPFEYDLVRFLYIKKRELDIER
jgi:phospholipid-binding lipoprotein MlaA